MATEYSDMKSIAGFFGVTRMQVYRWAKIISLPRWHWGYGSRRWEVEPWTEKDLIAWRDKIRVAKLGVRRHGRRAYKLWRTVR